jgi:hypothetical protein
MTLPSPVNPAFARAAISEYFADERWSRRAEEYGWTFAMIDPLTIIVFLKAQGANGNSESFVLRLSCDFYPTHPPDVRFVNPQTFEYDVATDLPHLANLQAQYCYLHTNYSYQQPYKYGPQLVCSSVALGYYFSNHTPKADEAWQPGKHTIGTTVYAVHRALHSPQYLGRHG